MELMEPTEFKMYSIKSFKHIVRYLRVFSTIITHTEVIEHLSNFDFKNKDNIVNLYQEINLNQLLLTNSEAFVLTYFKQFIKYHIELLNNPKGSNQNNHYFMNTALRNLKQQQYKAINFAACYKNFKNKNLNNLDNINNYFKQEESLSNYISNFINFYPRESWNEMPKTTFISDFTELMIDTTSIERNFRRVISNCTINNNEWDKKEKNIIFKYIALSQIRNPTIISWCFKFFLDCFKTFDINIPVYNYLCMKFSYHIISFTNYFKYFKDLKNNYKLKLIVSKEKLIISDHQSGCIKINEDETYFTLAIDEYRFILCCPNQSNWPKDSDIVNQYNTNNLLYNAECVFIPTNYDINDIKDTYLANINEFKYYFLYSVNPKSSWDRMNYENYKANFIRQQMLTNNIELSNTNDYFITCIKDISQHFDKYILKKQIKDKAP